MVVQAAQEAVAKERQDYADKLDSYLDEMKKTMDVTILTDDQRAAFKDACQPCTTGTAASIPSMIWMPSWPTLPTIDLPASLPSFPSKYDPHPRPALYAGRGMAPRLGVPSAPGRAHERIFALASV